MKRFELAIAGGGLTAARAIKSYREAGGGGEVELFSEEAPPLPPPGTRSPRTLPMRAGLTLIAAGGDARRSRSAEERMPMSQLTRAPSTTSGGSSSNASG